MSELAVETRTAEQAQSKGGRLGLVVALLLVTFLAALDIAVVITAMPTIIGQLGGFELYAWAVSAYLLTSTVSVPIYGRLADVYGRRPLLLIAIGVFLLGSALCGLAGNMGLFILFRAVQGVGAGGVLPVTITIIGDTFDAQTRARIAGLFSAAWSVAALLGPLVGGTLVLISWRLIFYVNVPLLLLAAWLVWRGLHEPPLIRSQGQVDYPGAATLAIGVSALLLLTVIVGGAKGIPGWLAWPTAAVSLIFLALFIIIERRSGAPLLPLGLFRGRLIAVAALMSFAFGIVLFASDTYIPMYVQGVRGGDALLAGLALTPLSLGWLGGATLSGRLLLRIGYRDTLLFGAGLIVIGAILLAGLGLALPWWYIVALTLMLGLGMGLATTALLIAVQDSVEYERRGVITALTQFASNMGGALGVALLGVALNATLSQQTARLASVETQYTRQIASLGSANDLLDPARRLALDPGLLGGLQGALGNALQVVYSGVLLVAALYLLTALFFPTIKPIAKSKLP
jgi:EmrB/QacA subfamily drug resistance transporter